MNAESYWPPIDEPFEYHVSAPWKVACVLLGIVFACNSGFFALAVLPHPAPIARLALGGGSAFLSLYFLCYAFRGLIQITSKGVHCRYAFTSRSMRRDEVAGKKECRAQRSGRVFYRVLSKSGRLMLIDYAVFRIDARFSAWLESLPTINT
jgi:hypothetical protein